jgi:hypothetical protein
MPEPSKLRKAFNVAAGASRKTAGAVTGRLRKGRAARKAVKAARKSRGR